jgi:hypothetical protein
MFFFQNRTKYSEIYKIHAHCIPTTCIGLGELSPLIEYLITIYYDASDNKGECWRSSDCIGHAPTQGRNDSTS